LENASRPAPLKWIKIVAVRDRSAPT